VHVTNVSIALIGVRSQLKFYYCKKMPAELVATYSGLVLTDAVQLEIPYAGSMMTVTQSFLRDKRDSVERVLRAYVEVMAVFLKQKIMAKKELAKYIRRDQPDVLEETYETASKYLEPIPRVDPRIVPAILGFADMRDVDVAEVTAKVIDNSVLDKLQREKFFDSLLPKTK